ncbi:hypothetical protein VM1G_01732 [Cytospora mali]|uniref:2EXR domain-containing protein n=1 Tax=Cytospora mali TaxID=578113 RepID=A0A194VS45_CYTMA|nr:hypothetical protein VM1G_01732 [Valsa mali]
MAGPIITTRHRLKRIKQEGFPKFKHLPPELRRMIWKEVMPPYGIVPVDCAVAQGKVRAPGAGEVQDEKCLHLYLSERYYQGPDSIDRNRTIQTLLATTHESREEVHKCFPDVLISAGDDYKEVLFNFKNDLIYITTPSYEVTLHDYPPKRLTPAFADGWNNKIHKVAVDTRVLRQWLGHLIGQDPPREGLLVQDARHINCFMDFVVACPNLKQVVFTCANGVTLDVWNNGLYGYKIPECLSSCHLGVVLNEYTCYRDSGHVQTDRNLVYPARDIPLELSKLPGCAQGLREVISGGADTSEIEYLGLIKFGYPGLQDLEILTMVHVAPQLRDYCLQMKFY